MKTALVSFIALCMGLPALLVSAPANVSGSWNTSWESLAKSTPLTIIQHGDGNRFEGRWRNAFVADREGHSNGLRAAKKHS